MLIEPFMFGIQERHTQLSFTDAKITVVVFVKSRNDTNIVINKSNMVCRYIFWLANQSMYFERRNGSFCCGSWFCVECFTFNGIDSRL